jgi:hypothetical protein
MGGEESIVQDLSPAFGATKEIANKVIFSIYFALTVEIDWFTLKVDRPKGRKFKM